MMSSHPDSKERAELAKQRAEKDGLYKPYVQQKKTTPVVKTTKKTTTKKTTTKKKK
jgi:putative metalloprotease